MPALPEEEKEKVRFQGVLYRLGLTANYRGFYQMASALELAWEQPERLLLVTKYIYPDVAKGCGATWRSVERNLRTAVRVIWQADTPMLQEVVGDGEKKKPNTARFLALIIKWLSIEKAAA